ncbi:MAG: pyridoxal-phosphate dependent enzyme [Candidatus Peribacteria bacterium]|jgi:cysteine synthase A|nr:pyridoxal-phosphate dependent enzyme [Candidatus Peribacteria bacterium]
MPTTNIFKGETALLDYLNPQNTLTPLVELPPHLNPFFQDNVHIFAKLLQTLPLTNVKSLPAFRMLANEEVSSLHTLIESSSGNTALSLAVIARILGIPTTKAIVSHEITSGKRKLLQLFGVEMIVHKEAICPNPNDPSSSIYQAKVYGKQSGRINPGQYDNPKNPEAHYHSTGPQIYEQLQGDIQLFCAGLGTTGTMIGTAKFLKEKNAYLHTLGVVRKPNNPVPGPRTHHLLRQIAFHWEQYVDAIVAV